MDYDQAALKGLVYGEGGSFRCVSHVCVYVRLLCDFVVSRAAELLFGHLCPLYILSRFFVYFCAKHPKKTSSSDIFSQVRGHDEGKIPPVPVLEGRTHALRRRGRQRRPQRRE